MLNKSYHTYKYMHTNKHENPNKKKEVKLRNNIAVVEKAINAKLLFIHSFIRPFIFTLSKGKKRKKIGRKLKPSPEHLFKSR